MKYVVSAKCPPPYCPGIAYWERSVDPSNPGLLFAAMKAEGLKVPKDAGPPPAQGWLGIEWTENPIGFIPDGHVFEADVKPEYHFTEVGPCGHRIAERALTSLENARWFQSHGNILVKHTYASRVVIGQAALIDCLAIIMHKRDMDAFASEFATVQYKAHEVKPEGNSINAKPVFVYDPEDYDPQKRIPLADGEFITVMRRHGLKPKGTISEFD